MQCDPSALACSPDSNASSILSAFGKVNAIIDSRKKSNMNDIAPDFDTELDVIFGDCIFDKPVN